MRIGLFPLWAGSQIGGITTYDRELVPALASAAPDMQFCVFHSGPLPQFAASNVVHRSLFPSSRWITVPIAFPLAARSAGLDLVHMTHVPPPFFPGPYAMTLHCYSTFLHPEFYPKLLNLRLNMLIRRGLRQARVVICPSEGLRRIAERELGVPAEKLTVAPHGVSARFTPRPIEEARRLVREKYGVGSKYLLFVGVMAPRKNGVRIVNAFGRLKRNGEPDLHLLIVGRKWLGDEVDEAIGRNGIRDSVTFTGHVPEDDLPFIYSAAELFVFPTLWESFGIPVVESMACGAPVLTSDGSCLPETAGDAAEYVDPLSVDDIARGMARVLADPKRRQDLREKGLRRASQFTWENSARRTLAAYAHALQGR